MLSEKRLYLYDDSMISATPTSLNILDTYLENDNYTDLSGTKKPIITGELFINNPTNSPISEYEIATKYNKAFSGLVIRAAHITDAYRVRYEDESG